MKVINQTKEVTIGSKIRVADSFFTRLVGLLATKSLKPGEGLIIKPCASVHTFGMKYPIDAIFVDSSHTVVEVAAGLMPGCMAFSRGAAYVLELPQGTAAATLTQLGDKLVIAE